METRESGVRPQGWSSLTRVHRDALPSPDPFPSLPNKDSSQVGSHKSRQQTPQQGVAAPFVSVIRNGSQQWPHASRGREETTDEVVLRLREQHNWVDELFVRDVLGAVNGSEDAASDQLYAMFIDDSLFPAAPTPVAVTEVPNDSTSIDAAVSSRTSLQNSCSLTSLQEADVNGAVVPVEADDVYMKFRREALRMSRARDKHARLAYNAFMLGDHSLAKKFSREARELWRDAEKLHAQAAAEILTARNPDVLRSSKMKIDGELCSKRETLQSQLNKLGSNSKGGEGDIWSLDLHGLHASEAVLALQQRLAHMEEELSKNSTLMHGLPHRECSNSKAQNGDSAETVLRGAPRPLSKKELTVITGAGRHSKGGPSIPMAIRNFLLTHGYKFNDSRPGVIVVIPKRRFI